MSQVKRNIIANYAGSFWTALMGLAFVPLYIKFMGMESYGLIGVFGSIQGILSIMDLGISTTLNREIARRSVPGHDPSEIRDLVRTLEMIYWITAIILGLLVVSLSFPIARYWVNPEKLSMDDVQSATMIMGIIICLKWPSSFYSGGLMGLQKQVILNGLNVVMATVRGVGAVMALWLISPTIQTFLVWNIFAAGLATPLCAYFLWTSLPKSMGRRARFRKRILSEVWRFAVGMSGISLIGMVLGQIDKVVMSKMLTLEAFGYYMLAWTAAGGIYRLVGPIYAAIFPKFTQLVSINDQVSITNMYHKSCQLMSVVVFPVSLSIGVFSYQILSIWTGNQIIAEKTHLIVSVLSIGAACSASMWVPMGVQFAYGWTSLLFWVSVVAIVIMLPVLVLTVSLYGVLGGALSWTMLNVGSLTIYVWIMHLRLLKGEQWQYYIFDLSVPFCCAAVVTWLFRYVLSEHVSTITTIVIICTSTATAIAMAAVSASYVRNSLKNVFESLMLWVGSEATVKSK